MLVSYKLTSLKSFNSIYFKFLVSFSFSILFLGFYQPNYAQNWNILLLEGGKQTESANATAFDTEGNLYVLGAFEGKITLSDKKTVLESKGNKDIFLAKYNAFGKLVWAKRAGGTGSDIGYGIAINSKNEICVTGHFSLKADFSNLFLDNPTGFTSIFIAKYNSEGNVLWVEEVVNSKIYLQGSEGRGIACDENDNIFVTGALCIIKDNITEDVSNKDLDIFVAKYSTKGNWIMTKFIGGKYINDTGYGITVNKNYVYITGIYKGKMTLFGKEMGIDSYSTSGFLAAFDTDLNPKWIRDFGGRAEYNHAWAVDTDSKGNIYMAGRVEGIANLDNTAIYTIGKSDIFLAKYDKEGNLIWFRVAGGTGWDVAHALTITEKDEIYIAGIFEGKANFGSKTLYSKGGWDGFLALYDKEGNVKEANQLGGTKNDAFYGLSSSKDKMLALVGRSESDLFSINNATISTKGNSDALIFAITNPKNSSSSSQNTNDLDKNDIKKFAPLIYPNPTNGKITIRFEEIVKENIKIVIYDRIGKFVEHYTIKSSELDFSKKEFILSLPHLSQGIYLIKINTQNQEYSHKIFIEK